jgi:hypothetical protein
MNAICHAVIRRIPDTLCDICQWCFDGHCGGANNVKRCGSFEPIIDRPGHMDPNTGDATDLAAVPACEDLGFGVVMVRNPKFPAVTDLGFGVVEVLS